MTFPFRLTAAAIALALGPSLAGAADFGPLVTPQELSTLAGEDAAPLVLDIRAEGEDGYGGGHIEGAVNAPYQLFRGPAENPGAVPDDATLTSRFRELGISREQPVVVVHQGSDDTDFGAAARVYWTLKSSGVSQLAILNGGVNGWKEAGLPLSTEAVTPTPSDIDVTLSDQWLADAGDVQAVIDGESGALLLDARPESFWKGEEAHPAAARPGTLPDSRDLPHSSWFQGDGALIDAAAAVEIAQSGGIAADAEVVSFCNTGHWAATNWFALSELAGVEGVKLYPESMVGWSQDENHAMSNVPGRLQNLWNQIKGN